jgi:hypothetical protein
LTVEQMARALSESNVNDPAELASSSAIAELRTQIATLGTQQIRSQHLRATGEGDTMPPAAFQVFGQRFLLDSFVLSKVVFDSISFKGKQPRRGMPSGLDVMAELGSQARRLEREPLQRLARCAPGAR